MLSQYTEDMVIGAIYYEGEKGWTMVKRFKIETNTLAQKFYFIPEGITSKLYFATTHTGSCIKITYKNGGQKEEYEFMLDEFIDIKGWKALGNKLFEGKMMKVEELSYNQPAEPQDHSPVQGDLFGGKGGDKGGKLKSGDTVEW